MCYFNTLFVICTGIIFIGSSHAEIMATRWGIVGAGHISHDFVSAIRILPQTEHEVVAVAARNITRAQDFAKLHDIKKSYGSYEDISNDKDIDIVYIGTISPTHYKIAKMMLNSGKNVLCEKPLTINLWQAKELIDLAKEKDVFFMEAVWSRFFPIYESLREELKNGSIGEVKQLFLSLGAKLTHVERLNKKELGGGSILDIGVYVLQFASLVFNGEKPKIIKSSGHLNEDGVDVSTSTTFIYENGRTATMVTQFLVDVPNEAFLLGTHGMIKVPNFWVPTSMELPNRTIEIDLPKSEAKFNFINSAGLSYEAGEVRNCLLKGLKESPKMTHADSLLVTDLMDELRRQVGVTYEADNEK